MKQNLKSCPVCDSDLAITRYECPSCRTKIEGTFKQTMFAELSAEQLEFIKIFLISHGSIKEVEKRLKISYPTVKNRLSVIVEVLTGKEESEVDHLSILDKIDSGDLSVEEALNLLNK
ncbi:MAG: hypothetical protein B6226_03840 [Candidatus Cloacimonetes bacterium 4572_65]|nr:MAG: hypothetical protein B6226_03840 [Candidatus Cloacimonetes bacterium 4572_65]